MIVFGAVDSLARGADADDTRSIDARRVDALVDLCRLYAGPSVGSLQRCAAGRGGQSSGPARSPL